jgi:AraC-like DNA-binding protein
MKLSAFSLPQPPTVISGSVPASYVGLLFDYLEALGEDADLVLGLALSNAVADTSAAPGAAYPAHSWRGMLERAAEYLQDPALGLHLGASIRPAHLGPLGYVLLASSSISVAIARYIRYQRLVHDVSPVHCYQDGASLVLEWGSDSRAIGLLANQCGMAALVQFARDITDAKVTPVALHFVELAPADVAPYAQMFGCPVLFQQSATRLIFDASLLQLPLRRADPALAAMLEQQVQALFAALPQQDALEKDLRLAILHRLPLGEPALDGIAQDLHLSGRTLRRRLQQRGWSFRVLLDDTRWRLAQDYLRDGRLALPEVALLLGYSEQSAFSRAFLRWSGITPKRWRLAAHTNALK